MTDVRVALFLWIGVSLFTALGMARWRHADVESGPYTPATSVARSSAESHTLDSAGVRTRAVITRNPFRLARRPSDVSFRPDGVYEAAATPEPPRPPPLVLTGITGGPPWRALVRVQGAPPANRIVSSGDTVAGFIVARVARDSLVLESTDTTLHLHLSRR